MKSLLIAIACFLPLPVYSLSAQDIAEQSNLAAVYPGNDGRTEARMMIVDKQGRKQFRQFSLLRKNQTKGGNQHFLAVFSRPADVKRTTFLVKKRPGTEDYRWLYLPGLDLVKRITAKDKRTSFVGSTFFYEDISGRDIQADNFELMSETDQHWQLKATPKAPSTVEFAWYQVTIDKANFLPQSARYYDQQGKLYRTMTALKVKKVQGIPTIYEMKAENTQTGHYTVVQMRNIEYNLGLPDRVFSERSLRTPPKRWLP